MNAEELIAKIDDIFDGDFSKLPEERSSDEEYKRFETELGEIDIVKFCEKQIQNRDTVEFVMYFKDFNIYLALNGYYNSWTGDKWQNELFEVVPTEYKKIIYTKK